MNFSRRSFLWTGSQLGLAAVVTNRLSSFAFGQSSSQNALELQLEGLGTSVPRKALGDPLYRINRAMFTENLKSKFTFQLGGVKLTDMSLNEVIDLNPGFFNNDGTGTRDCFSLVFKGPRGLKLQQGTYTVKHGTLGTFQLFIVPGESNGSGRRYEALINRL